MPWNGAGTFTRLYNFVADAANGIKILASKQDAEWANVVTGLNNVLCRDGQNSPSANINWNGKKITNLANGTAATDAATVGQISATNEWTAETATLTYVSGTSLKTLAGDTTGVYTPGRRVKASVTAGTVYGTVVSASYSAPDTTLVFTFDAGSLDSGLSALSYGAISATNSSRPYTTDLVVGSSLANVAASTTTIAFQSTAANGDKMSEWTNGATGRFTAKVAGVYFVSVMGVIQQSGANIALGDAWSLAIYKNGTVDNYLNSITWPLASGAGAAFIPLGGCGYASLSAGEYLDVRVEPPAYVSGTAKYSSLALNIRRVGV